MFKRLFPICFLVGLAVVAYAETKLISGDNVNIDATQGIQLCAGTGTVRIASDCTGGGTQSVLEIADGQIAHKAVAPVMTPATSFPTPPATPGTGSQVAARHSIIVAGAPTATFVQLPQATISVGKTFTVVNQSSNPAAIVPVSGDTQGVSAAATPYACTTLKTCDCVALTNSNWMCGLK